MPFYPKATTAAFACFLAIGLARVTQVQTVPPPPNMQNLIVTQPVPYEQAMREILGRTVAISEPKRASPVAPSGARSAPSAE